MTRYIPANRVKDGSVVRVTESEFLDVPGPYYGVHYDDEITATWVAPKEWRDNQEGDEFDD